MKRILGLSILLNSSLLISFGQTGFRGISPAATAPRIATVHGNHIISAPDSRRRLNQLIISMAGTGGSAMAMNPFDSVGNLMGFHTMSLDYKNEVVTTVCRASLDSSCFDSFRQEIVFGTPVSDTVRVDSVNSIYNRIYCLLRFLSMHYPNEGWENFFRNKNIVWPNIIVAGHSQGAGHAAFLGKHFHVAKVILLAGPQDFLDSYDHPAPWVKQKSETPGKRFKALLHYQDPYGFKKQLASCLILSETQAKDTLLTTAIMDKKNGNIVVSHLVTGSPHGSVAAISHAEIWRYLLAPK